MLLIIIGALLGAIYGWVYHYWLPSSGWGLIVWGAIGGLGGWAYATDDGEDSEAAAVAGLILGAVFAVAIALLLGDVRAASLGAFLGFFGGVTILSAPGAAIVGGLVGLLIGVADVVFELFQGNPLSFGNALTQILGTGAAFFILIPFAWSRRKEQ